jgi:hypothetical protein
MTGSAVQGLDVKAGELVGFTADPQLLSEVLRRYEKSDTHYLKSATVIAAHGLAVAQAEFSVSYSPYLNGAGHLGSVEVNICFDQLAQYLIAKSVKEGAVPALGVAASEQLPDMHIASYRSTFRRPINSASFSGEVAFASFTEGNGERPIQLADMPWRFWDESGGYAEGEVRVSLHSPPAQRFMDVAA